ncbi:hypothetical protein [Mesorhizobium sp. WSM3882]|uniref:maleate cis-trans isomerase family protein n=1 Tax=Mesorhizobium sp. WSM3882 TaxID=2029407 RepID=UPI000BB0C858|nr:hypothetical protein [Mesorhizobium sp. WSM3882]PBB28939.1 hypothetical protein CK214_28105 [Mesorhizobium sp. WSM3882]
MLEDDKVAFAAARIKHHEPDSPERAVENLYRHAFEIARAGELFDPPGAVNVSIYACTSGSATISQDRLEEELRRTRPNASITSPMMGALRAFHNFRASRIAMLTPYIDEVGAIVVKCIEDSGFTVRGSASFNLSTDSAIAAVSPESIFEAACSIDTQDSDALFIPCTLLRASSVIERLESRIGKPVITAHQAMLWDALRLAGYKNPVAGHGRLLMQRRW